MANAHPYATPHLDLDGAVPACRRTGRCRRSPFGIRPQLHRQKTGARARPQLASPCEQQTRADLMAFRNTLGHRARGKRLLHNPKLVGRRPTPPPLTANPYLDLLRKIALKRPLTSLV